MKTGVAVEGHLRPERRVPDDDAARAEELLEVGLARIAAEVGEEREAADRLHAKAETGREEVAHADAAGACRHRQARCAGEIVAEHFPAQPRDDRQAVGCEQDLVLGGERRAEPAPVGRVAGGIEAIRRREALVARGDEEARHLVRADGAPEERLHAARGRGVGVIDRHEAHLAPPSQR